MSGLLVWLLGPPRIDYEGTAIEVGRRKAVALLVYLVMTRQNHHRDELATLFWPASSQSRARGNLRRVLSDLNQALDASCLDGAGETVGLKQDIELWLDIDHFRDRLAACHSHNHPPAEVCSACLSLLTEAAALYRHDFLAGFTLRNSPEFDEWQFYQAERLRQELAAALERLVRGHSVQGAYETAIGYAQRWLALDPLHEPVQRWLMQLYAHTGQRAKALRQYAECERLLKEELGLPPEEETLQLYQTIKEERSLSPPLGPVTPSRRKPISQKRASPVGPRPGRYRRERKVGEGGMGEVWLATDTLLDRPVAVKYPLVASPVSGERLLQEARLLARLNHPNITTLYDFFIDQDERRFYLVMEFVEGKSLATIIKESDRLPLEICLEIAQGLLRALSYAHQQGIIHRDITPGNVLIADDVKLTDFGLANLAALLKRGTGFMAGTPAYMAPEQIEGRPTDGRADLYSLGVLLFELLSGGQLPFAFTDEDELLAAHLHAPPPRLNQVVPDLPPALEQIILRLMAKEPAGRYPSAEAVLEALGFYDGQVEAKQPGVAEKREPGPPRHNLPVPSTPFIGREADLAEVIERLQAADCRLLTLIGPGGSGKTRLAREAAATQLDHYPHGVYFVRLAPLQSVAAMVPTVAEACGFSFYEGEQPRQQLLDYLRQKEMLLILDNFEHLLDGVSLITDILETAPGLKVLTTSRIRLNLQNEHLFPVTGMDFPDWGTPADADRSEEAIRYSAIKLFMDSVRRTQPSFEPTTKDLTDVVQICRSVQGLPLGIELAAGWAELLTPAEIATEIDHSLDFLETDLQDVPERQRSMRAVFDHSWRLLTTQERAVFQTLSVFRGGFTREAAQQVTGASLRQLMALANKSLLQRTSTGRYELHELLRQYAVEKLKTSEEVDAARNAHSVYYAEFLHQREADLTGRRQLEALDEIEVDFENVRAAWNWALKQKNYTAIGQSMGGLSWFCAYRSRDQEYKELFQQAREQLAPDPDEEPHLVWGRILGAEYFISREVDSVERALAIAQKHNNRRLLAVCLRILGEIAFNAGDQAKALSLYEESLAHFRDLDHSFFIAEGLYEIAETYRLLGQPEEAIKFARQSLAMSREIGDKYWAGQSLVNTGVIALYTGNYTEAEGHLREANTIARELGYRKGIAESNVVLGKLAFLNGDFEAAKVLAEEALEIATDIGNKRIAESFRGLSFVVATALDDDKDEQELAPITDIPPTIDRFEVKEVLGVGSWGAVYQAHDPDNGCDVALKVTDREALMQSNRLKNFNREAEVMAKLAHPAIPEYYGYGEMADSVFFAMEYIDGSNLEEMLEAEKGFLPEKMVIEWALQLCDALTHIHNQKPESLVFRDLKPVNVMVDHNNKLYLIDFGITIAYKPGREQAMMMIGTKGYSPPEQYIGYSDARSDIYALGATLHHLLTRRDPRREPPFSFHDAPPRSLNPAISEEMEAVILKAVEYRAEDRYQTAEEMKSVLLACL